MFDKTVAAAGALAVLASLSAFGAAGMTSKMSGGASSMDRRFMTTLAQGSMAEVKLGKLALQKTHNAQVRQVANTIVTDHSKANASLKQVAGQEGVRLPKDTDPAHRAM
ncbi:MAG: DUF4142 domain-containing protein [Armatimonadetes bacterium]|nr:DUF4142 domain-containing protein [Armatimonadota bacterium]